MEVVDDPDPVISPPLAVLGMAGQAGASALGPTFTVIDLGSDYRLVTDPGGRATGVAGGGGGPTYAFDKPPTIAIDKRLKSDGIAGLVRSYAGWYTIGLHKYSYMQFTLQNGDRAQGYLVAPPGGGMNPPFFVPLGFNFAGSWHNELASRSPT